MNVLAQLLSEASADQSCVLDVHSIVTTGIKGALEDTVLTGILFLPMITVITNSQSGSAGTTSLYITGTLSGCCMLTFTPSSCPRSFQHTSRELYMRYSGATSICTPLGRISPHYETQATFRISLSHFGFENNCGMSVNSISPGRCCIDMLHPISSTMQQHLICCHM